MLDELGGSTSPPATTKGDAWADAWAGTDVLEVIDTNGNDLADDVVVVNACGRTITTHSNAVQSVPALQGLLQQELSIKGQNFELYDGHGVSLVTDSDLRYAVKTGRMPIVANLCEASAVHCIEARREELAQMQWKLLRDQVSGLAEKILSVGHRVQELSEAISIMKREREADVGRAKAQLNVLVDNAKDAAQQSFLQLAERVDAMAQSISSERSNREASKHGTENMIQSLRDQLTADRSTRRTEQASFESHLDEVQQAMLSESRLREDFEVRHSKSMNFLSDRIEALSATQVEKHQDLEDQFKSHMDEVHKSNQDYVREVVQVQNEAESSKIELSSRFKRLEDRTACIDQRLTELIGREARHFDELQAKHSKTHAGLEHLRLEERGRGLEMRRRAISGNWADSTNGHTDHELHLQDSVEVCSSDLTGSTQAHHRQLERRSLSSTLARSQSPPTTVRMESMPGSITVTMPSTSMLSAGGSHGHPAQSSQRSVSPMMRTGALSPQALSPQPSERSTGSLPIQRCRSGALSPTPPMTTGVTSPLTSGRARAVSPYDGRRSQSPVPVHLPTERSSFPIAVATGFQFGTMAAQSSPHVAAERNRLSVSAASPAGSQCSTKSMVSVTLPAGMPSAIPLRTCQIAARVAQPSQNS